MSWPEEVSQGAQEFIVVQFDTEDDLTSATVEIGLSADPVAQPTAWLPAGWPTLHVNTARTSAVWNTTAVDPGYYKIWARVTDTPEIIPRAYGVLRVTDADAA